MATLQSQKLLTSLVVLLAILIGILQVTQNGINIALTNWTNFPLRSAFINFFVGSITLFPLFLFYKPKGDDVDSEISLKILLFQNLFSALKQNKKNYLVFFNGTCGIIWILTAIYIAPQIGFGLYAICTVIGQILFSIIIDHFGLIWTQKKKLSILNIFGSFIAISGVIIFQIPAIIKNDNEDSSTINPFLLFIYMILSIFAGMFYTMLSALNRRLKIIMKSTPYQPAFMLFSNAAIILLIVNITIHFVDKEYDFSHSNLKWYMFFGGMLGAFIVSMYIICLLQIGFVTTYICSIFGALIISLIYDIIGAFGVDNAKESNNNLSILWKIVGVICVLIGAIIMNLKRQIHDKIHNNNDETIHKTDKFRVVSTTELPLEDCRLEEFE